MTSYKLNKPAAESLAQAHQSEITEGELGNVNSTEHGMGFGSAQLAGHLINLKVGLRLP